MAWIKHRGGPIGKDFSPGWEGRILDEVDRYEDPKEDLSVTVLHENGWYLSVVPFGSVLLDHSEDETGGPQTAVLPEDDLIDALRAIARGDVATISRLIEAAQDD